LTGARTVNRRRNNAPIRPRKPATIVPDLLFAIAVAAWVMAAVFMVATFTHDTLSAGNAGTALARLFAATLAIAGLCGFLIGVLLLRDERQHAEHYVVPMVLGAVIGAAEAWLFLIPAPSLLFLPFLLLIFVFRPFRRLLTGLTSSRSRSG
jgi:ABC-type methionine transport system permease subunit